VAGDASQCEEIFLFTEKLIKTIVFRYSFSLKKPFSSGSCSDELSFLIGCMRLRWKRRVDNKEQDFGLLVEKDYPKILV